MYLGIEAYSLISIMLENNNFENANEVNCFGFVFWNLESRFAKILIYKHLTFKFNKKMQMCVNSLFEINLTATFFIIRLLILRQSGTIKTGVDDGTEFIGKTSLAWTVLMHWAQQAVHLR